MEPKKIQEIELSLFLNAVKLRHDYDFSRYAKSSLMRRVKELVRVTGEGEISGLISRVLYDDSFIHEIVSRLSIQVSEMFRDAPSYLMIRREIVPMLKTHPRINIWVAGCANGEEAYSMAILLQEEGLFEKSQIFATDISPDAIKKARAGIFSPERLEQAVANYEASGGKGRLSNYYTLRDEQVVMDPSIRKIIFFAEHNLASDSVFCEAHLILCRNVLIYFDKPLQIRVLQLFLSSLVRGGFLSLGSAESLSFPEIEDQFETVAAKEKLFRKKYARGRVAKEKNSKPALRAQS